MMVWKICLLSNMVILGVSIINHPKKTEGPGTWNLHFFHLVFSNHLSKPQSLGFKVQNLRKNWVPQIQGTKSNHSSGENTLYQTSSDQLMGEISFLHHVWKEEQISDRKKQPPIIENPFQKSWKQLVEFSHTSHLAFGFAGYLLVKNRQVDDTKQNSKRNHPKKKVEVTFCMPRMA